MSNRNTIQAIRGVEDLLPVQAPLWHRIEDAARDVFATFGFQEIRTPLLEPTPLFARSIGEATDIVEKEMYTFDDKGGEPVTLRPEGTAGAVRAYVEHNLSEQLRLAKLYYMGPMFRRERPQKGRLRQFHQIGAEVLGSAAPGVEATLLVMLKTFFERLGLESTKLEINSLGGPESRALYRQRIYEHFKPRIGDFCGDCQRRIETNPLRILDCKVDGEKTRGAPQILDFLNDQDKEHWHAVLRRLEDAGLTFDVNPRIVRGLDYYTRTVFEFTTDRLGAQNTVAAGGRYDGLVEQLGGKPTPAAGFAVGIERLALLLSSNAKTVPAPHRPKLFIASLGAQAERFALLTMLDLARQGIWCEIDYEGGSLKSQMRYADRLGAEYVLVLGDNELAAKKGDLKRMSDGSKEPVELGKLAEKIA
ncbi:MAG: histidine--tRNA ligase [Bdellovibrionota bacterium]